MLTGSKSDICTQGGELFLIKGMSLLKNNCAFKEICSLILILDERLMTKCDFVVGQMTKINARVLPAMFSSEQCTNLKGECIVM